MTTPSTTATKDPSPPLPAPLLPFALLPRLDVAYVSDFITEHEEEALLRHLRPPPPSETSPGWRIVSGRRVRALGGAVQGVALTAAPLPSYIMPLLEKLRETGAFRGGEEEKDDDEKKNSDKTCPPPNHCLVNSYSPGEGIMPHEDGPIYLPCAAIVSLGSWAVLRFYSKRAEEENDEENEDDEEEEQRRRRDRKRSSAFSVALAPRSLVVFAGEAYKCMLHGIEAVEEEVLDASVLNFNDEEEGEGRERRRQRDEQVARAAVVPSSRGGNVVIPRGVKGLGATSDDRVSLTVRRVLRVRKNLLSRLGPRV